MQDAGEGRVSGEFLRSVADRDTVCHPALGGESRARSPAHRVPAVLQSGPGRSPAENQLRGRRGAVARFGVTRSAFCPGSGQASKNKIPPFSFPRDVSTFSGF